jgi:hypothetical protein
MSAVTIQFFFHFAQRRIFPYNPEPVLDRNMFNYTEATERIPLIRGLMTLEASHTLPVLFSSNRLWSIIRVLYVSILLH